MLHYERSNAINKTEIKPSPISGQGTFAKEDIASGEFITSFTGKERTLKEIDDMCDNHEIPENDPLQIEEELFLVLDYESKVINHSCDPNSGLRHTNELFAIKDIKKGEEITYDYSTTVGGNDEFEMACRCGSPNCRKTIGTILTLPKERLAYYVKVNALQDFIKKQLKKYKSLV